MSPSPDARNVSWLTANFVNTSEGVEHAVIVSPEGSLLATAGNPTVDDAYKVSAIVAGLRSLADGAAHLIGKGDLAQVIVEMKQGYLFSAAVADGSSLGVVTTDTADLGQVGYAITVLVDQLSHQLTAEVVAELMEAMAASDPVSVGPLDMS